MTQLLQNLQARFPGQTGTQLPLPVYSELCQHLRQLLGTPLAFVGEAVIDSDRHEGNLLFEYNQTGRDQLTVIDTGAGTIVTRAQRQAMFFLVSGALGSSVELFMQGLSGLMPAIDRLTAESKQALTADIGQILKPLSHDRLKQNLQYDFLLQQGLLDGSLSESALFAPLADSNYTDRAMLLDLNKPEQSWYALIHLLVHQGVKCSPAEADSIERLAAYKEFLAKSNFERLLAVHPQHRFRPTTWLTDGHNALLFIKTIRRVANVLDQHGIHAPELVIQINRGTKFVEDQIAQINRKKSELRTQLQAQQVVKPSPQIIRWLAPIELGPAYVRGVLSKQVVVEQFQFIGMALLPMFGALTRERTQSWFGR